MKLYVHCRPNTIKSNEINSFIPFERYINSSTYMYGYKTWFMQTARAIFLTKHTPYTLFYRNDYEWNFNFPKRIEFRLLPKSKWSERNRKNTPYRSLILLYHFIFFRIVWKKKWIIFFSYVVYCFTAHLFKYMLTPTNNWHSTLSSCKILY